MDEASTAEPRPGGGARGDWSSLCLPSPMPCLPGCSSLSLVAAGFQLGNEVVCSCLVVGPEQETLAVGAPRQGKGQDSVLESVAARDAATHTGVLALASTVLETSPMPSNGKKALFHSSKVLTESVTEGDIVLQYQPRTRNVEAMALPPKLDATGGGVTPPSASSLHHHTRPCSTPVAPASYSAAPCLPESCAFARVPANLDWPGC